MTKYLIRKINANDYRAVAAVYNSNQRFLFDHLGRDCVDESFIAEEALTMSNMGFHSCVIVNGENQVVQGVLEYKEGRETYLSLLMLAADLQGQGIGRAVYAYFESKILQSESDSIRIDVVNDDPENVVPFWKSLGFLEYETVTLDWGNKRSRAIVMRKDIQQ